MMWRGLGALAAAVPGSASGARYGHERRTGNGRRDRMAVAASKNGEPCNQFTSLTSVM
jgi:hypothetical protein